MFDKVYLRIKKKEDVVVDESLNYPKEANKEDSKKGYTMLKEMLEVLDVPFDINSVKFTEDGKPYLENSKIKFNYSHSKNYIACALSFAEVGCDIEDEFNVTKEGSELVLDSSTNRIRKAWVKRESYCKLLGKFDKETFRNVDLNNIDKNFYAVSNNKYDCSVYYDGEEKNLLLM